MINQWCKVQGKNSATATTKPVKIQWNKLKQSTERLTAACCVSLNYKIYRISLDSISDMCTWTRHNTIGRWGKGDEYQNCICLNAWSISNFIHFSCVVCLCAFPCSQNRTANIFIHFPLTLQQQQQQWSKREKCQQWLRKSGGACAQQLSIDLQIFWRLTLTGLSCLPGWISNEIYFIELTFRILFFFLPSTHTHERMKHKSRHCISISIEFIGSFHAFLSTTNLCVFDK